MPRAAIRPYCDTLFGHCHRIELLLTMLELPFEARRPADRRWERKVRPRGLANDERSGRQWFGTPLGPYVGRS